MYYSTTITSVSIITSARRTASPSTSTVETVLVPTLATWALVIQIALMYLGTVDESSWTELLQLLPLRQTEHECLVVVPVDQLNALSGSFATRENWINHFIRRTPWLVCRRA